MTHRPPLDSFIIAVAAINEWPLNPIPFSELLEVATEAWAEMDSVAQEKVRDWHRPAFQYVTDIILHTTAEAVKATDDGSVIDTYRTEFAAHLRDRAQNIKETR